MATNAAHLQLIEDKLEAITDSFTRSRKGDSDLITIALHHSCLLHRIAAFREISERCKEGLFMDNAMHQIANIEWFISDGNKVIRLYAQRKFKIRNPRSKKQHRRVRNYRLIWSAAYDAVEEAERLRDYLVYGE